MASENTPPDGETEEVRADWPVVGTRMHPDNVKRIDLARVYAGFKTRGEFIESAVLEKAERVLAAQSVVDGRA